MTPTMVDPSAFGDFASGWLVLLIQISVKSSLLIVATAGIVLMLRRAPAATRHLLWTLSVLAVLAVPLLSAMIPAWTVPISDPLRFDPPTTAGSAGINGSAPAAPLERLGGGLPALGSTSGTAGAVSPDPLAQPPMALARPESEPTRPATSPDALRALTDLSPTAWIFLLWELGVLLIGLRIGIQALRLRGLSRGALPVSDRGWTQLLAELRAELEIRPRVQLLQSTRIGTPLTWGLGRSFIMLPADNGSWSDEKRRNVLLHELAHVQRRDCLTQTLAQIACALHWFNPLVWIAAGRMHMEREKACDDRVLESGTRPSTYANDLVEIACSHSHEPAPAMAKRSQISDRVAALLDERQRRRPLGKRMAVGVTTMMCATALLLSALGFASPTPEPQSSPRSRGNEPSGREASRTELSGPAAEIAAANEDFKKAFEDGDLELLLSHYSEDAVLYPPIGEPMRGLLDIEDHYTAILESGIFHEVRSRTEELDVVDDTAYETGRYSAYGYGGDRISKGTYMSVWKNEGGTWRVRREMISVESQDLSQMNSRRARELERQARREFERQSSDGRY